MQGEEEAVLIFLDHPRMGDAVVRGVDLATLEDSLEQAVGDAGIGELDGHEIGREGTTLFLYGSSAEKIFQAITPLLNIHPLRGHARVVLRQGGPGAAQHEVSL